MGADAPPGLDLPAAPTNVLPDNLSTVRNASVRNTTRVALIAAAIVPELIIFSRPTGGVLIPHAVGWWVPLVACNSGIGIALMYHEACMKESFD
jgi:hypothetical protein